MIDLSKYFGRGARWEWDYHWEEWHGRHMIVPTGISYGADWARVFP